MKIKNLLTLALLSAAVLGCGGGSGGGDDDRKPTPTPEKMLKDVALITVNDHDFLKNDSNFNNQKIDYLFQILLGDGSTWMAMGQKSNTSILYHGGAYFKGTFDQDKLTANNFTLSLLGKDNKSFAASSFAADYVDNGSGKFTVTGTGGSVDFNLSGIRLEPFEIYILQNAKDMGDWRIKDEVTATWATLTWNEDKSFTATFERGTESAGTKIDCLLTGTIIAEEEDEFFRAELNYEGSECSNNKMAQNNLNLKGAGVIIKNDSNESSKDYNKRTFYLVATSADGSYTRFLSGNKLK